MRNYALALDLKDDPKLIEEYEEHHRKIWPEIRQSILDSGVKRMEIYRIQNHLFMTMEVADDFSFEEKDKADAANPKVQEWETLMWKYQQRLPGSKPGEKWILMDRIFELKK